LVLSNDPIHSKYKLLISGQVEKFATILPKTLRLTGEINQKIVGSVSIVPEKKYPFKILKAEAKNGKRIQYQLDEGNGSAYKLNVETTSATPGIYSDAIVLKTDSPIQPEIPIRIFAQIRDPKAQAKSGQQVNPSGKQAGNQFIELIRKMQAEKAAGKSSGQLQPQTTADKELLKKKFEALIKEARKKQAVENKAIQKESVVREGEKASVSDAPKATGTDG